MDFAWVSALALLVAAHLLRRAVPSLAGLRERRLPFSWPWLELLGLALGWLLGRGSGWPPGDDFWPLAALSLLLLAACGTDYLVKLIPDSLTFGGAAAGAALAIFFPAPILGGPLHDLLVEAWALAGSAAGVRALALSFAGAVVGFALLELVRRVAGLAAGLEVMGMGDSKLLMMIGAFLGPAGAAITLALAFLVGVLHGLVAAAMTRKPHAPFGPALAAGAWLYLFAAGAMAEHWQLFQSFVWSLPLPWLVAGYATLLACVLLLILRVRRRAAEYEEIIEADYREIDLLLTDGDAGEAGAAAPAVGEESEEKKDE